MRSAFSSQMEMMTNTPYLCIRNRIDRINGSTVDKKTFINRKIIKTLQ